MVMAGVRSEPLTLKCHPLHTYRTLRACTCVKSSWIWKIRAWFRWPWTAPCILTSQGLNSMNIKMVIEMWGPGDHHWAVEKAGSAGSLTDPGTRLLGVGAGCRTGLLCWGSERWAGLPSLLREQRSWGLIVRLPDQKSNFLKHKRSTHSHHSPRASAEGASSGEHPSVNHPRALEFKHLFLCPKALEWDCSLWQL